MSQEKHLEKMEVAIKRRRQDVAYLYFEGWSVKEIAEYSGYSITTINKDIHYIEAHREEY